MLLYLFLRLDSQFIASSEVMKQMFRYKYDSLIFTYTFPLNDIKNSHQFLQNSLLFHFLKEVKVITIFHQEKIVAQLILNEKFLRSLEPCLEEYFITLVYIILDCNLTLSNHRSPFLTNSLARPSLLIRLINFHRICWVKRVIFVDFGL